jgi:DNA-binding response OmpR family regulator
MQGARVLLIEDEEILSDLIARNLRARNHEVSIASSVQSALAALRARQFDLIFLDINLPDKSGWDVLRIAQSEGSIQPIKVGEGEYQLPVVVLSAVRVSSKRLAEFHPLAYLPKPFPMEALLRLAEEAALRRHPQVSNEQWVAASERSLPNEEELHA